MAESVGPPLDAGIPRGKSGVEIYRSIRGAYAWRVTVVADDNSETALRDARTLAVELEIEIGQQYGGRGRAAS